MIGNNACGSAGARLRSDRRQRRWPRRASRRRRARCLDAGRGGARLGDRWPACAELVAATWRRSAPSFGRFSRQVSGYSPGAPAARARPSTSPGSWSAPRAPSAVVAGATVRLVADAPARRARRARLPRRWPTPPTPCRRCSPLGPVACEGLDAPARRRGPRRRGAAAVPDLPRGDGWLFVELAGDDAGRGGRRAAAGGRAPAGAGRPGGHRPGRRLPRCGGSARTAPVWPRAPWPAGALRAGRTPRSRRSSSGAYLRDFDALLVEHGLDGAAVRPLRRRLRARPHRLPARRADGGRRLPRLRRDAAAPGRRARRLPVRRARRRPCPLASCCPLMYSPSRSASSPRSRTSSTRTNLLNPGVLVDPAPARRRPAVARPTALPRLAFGWPHDGGFARGRAPLHRGRQVPATTPAPAA